MIVKPIQSNFSSGEISPRLRSQSTLPQVATSCKHLENIHAESHGMALGRDGFDLIGADEGDAAPIRILDFHVNVDESYIVVFRKHPVPTATHTTIIQVYESTDTDLTTPELFQGQDIALGGNNIKQLDHTVLPYLENEIQDVHYVVIKDFMYMVHSHYPPFRLFRYTAFSGADQIFWGYGFHATWGAEWGYGLRLYESQAFEANKKLGFPRTIGYYQQRIVYGGMTHAPHRLVFTRTDDLSTIDKGFWSTLTDDPTEYLEQADIDSGETDIKIIKIRGHQPDVSLITVFQDFVEVDPSTYTATQLTQDTPATGNPPDGGFGYGADGFIYRGNFRPLAGGSIQIEFTATISFTATINAYMSRPVDSGLVYDIAATDQNHVQWIATGEGLFLGTTGGEWVADVENFISNLTPPRFSLVGSNGSQHIQPIRVGDSVIHVTANGRELRSFRGDFTAYRDKWVSHDLAWQSEHLFSDYSIQEIAYVEIPDSLIYIKNSNGELFSCVYEPDRDPEQVGWSRHPLNSKIRSIARLRDADYDRLYAVMERTFVTGTEETPVVTTEVSLELTNNSSTMDYKKFVEDGTPFATIDLTGSSLLDKPSERFAVGIDQQIPIAIMADGALDFYGTYDEMAASGRLASNIWTLVTPARFVEYGIPFIQRIQPSDLDYQADGSVYAEKKRHPKVWLDLIESQPPLINGRLPSGRSTNTLMGNLEPPIDGKVKGYSIGSSENLHVDITQPFPYRLQLTAVFGSTVIGNKT